MAMNEPIEFLIQARNDNGVNRESGRDEFTVKIMTTEDQAVEIPCQVNDSGDGQYHVIYSVDRPVAVSVKICFRDEYGDWVPVRGSPYNASFIEETPAKMNPLIGPSLNKYAISQIEGL